MYDLELHKYMKYKNKLNGSGNEKPMIFQKLVFSTTFKNSLRN